METYQAVLAMFPVDGNILQTTMTVHIAACTGEDRTDAMHDALFQIAEKMGYRLVREDSRKKGDSK